MHARILASILLIAPVAASGEGGPDWPDCWCRGSSGERYELGERTCLTIGDRTFTARCEMAGNVPIWRDEAEGCVTG
jgi:hypothetical protein